MNALRKEVRQLVAQVLKLSKEFKAVKAELEASWLDVDYISKTITAIIDVK